MDMGYNFVRSSNMECLVRDLNVHYEVFGEGKPLLLLHGWSIDHSIMVSTMEPLFQGRSGWQRFYPDLPAHGLTPARPWITGQDQMLEVVLGFIDALFPGRPFAVAGSSLGAYLARGILHHRADLIDGLLLSVPCMIADDAHRTLPPQTVVVKDEAFLGP
jgi:pimeloyl-ACP methyl ester carboxylesterase